MKIGINMIVALGFTFLCVAKESDDEKVSEILNTKEGSGSMIHALTAVRLINELKWENAESMLTGERSMLPILIRDSKMTDDWGGVGAYRGSEVDAQGKTIKHRFAYGPSRKTPHEVWITYSLSANEFDNAVLTILGW